MDNLASSLVQTIRDAHRIVVGITGATDGILPVPSANDTLLNLNPYTAGVSADFIDTGDGIQLAAAIAVASSIQGASTKPVDIRVVSGVIDFQASNAFSGPLTIPTGCRLIGAGKELTEFVGLVGLPAASVDQCIFVLDPGATVEDCKLTSPAPVGIPAGTHGGILSAAGRFSVKNVAIVITDLAGRFTSGGIIGTASLGNPQARISDVDINHAAGTKLIKHALAHFVGPIVLGNFLAY
jgi:hypothetical protein